MALTVPHAQLTQLRAVFGSRIPKDADRATEMLAQSPAAPQSAAELAALRTALVELAGVELDEVKASAAALAHGQPVDAGQRSTPGPLSLQLSQMTGDLKVASAPGLTKVITPARAQALFDQIAADPRIPHRFIDDGCHFRSTLSAKVLEDEGVFSEKIVLNANHSDLKILSDYSPIGFTLAMFHMATVLWVDDGKGPQRRVIDPSLGDRPLSLEEWSSNMYGLNREPCDLYFLPRFCSHPMDRDAPPASWQAKDLEEAEGWSTQYKAFEEMLIKDGFYDQLPKMEAEMLALHAKDKDKAGGPA